MNPSDNIGLTDFLVLAYKFFKRNLIIFISFTLIGLTIGIVYNLQKQDYYSSEMIGFSNIIEKTALIEILNPLTTLTDEKNYEELSTKLGLSVEEASQIRFLSFTNSRHTKTSHSPSSTDIKLGNLIVVNTEVYDKKIFPKLESGVIKYLNDNSFIKQSEKLELQKTSNLISEISSNIAVIDSINSQPSKNNSAISIQHEINPFNYKEALLELENLKVDAQTLRAFTVVSSFYTIKNPSNEPLLSTIAATLAFFVIGLMFVFVKELAQLAKD